MKLAFSSSDSVYDIGYKRFTHAEQLGDIAAGVCCAESPHSRYISASELTIPVLIAPVFVAALGDFIVRVHLCIAKEVVRRVAAHPVVTFMEDVCASRDRAKRTLIGNTVRSQRWKFISLPDRPVSCFKHRSCPFPARILPARFIDSSPKSVEYGCFWLVLIPAISRAIRPLVRRGAIKQFAADYASTFRSLFLHIEPSTN